jgi:hypothetical protein
VLLLLLLLGLLTNKVQRYHGWYIVRIRRRVVEVTYAFTATQPDTDVTERN